MNGLKGSRSDCECIQRNFDAASWLKILTGLALDEFATGLTTIQKAVLPVKY